MPEFESTCPVCANGHGVPRAVTAARGTFTVTMVCDKCGHKWATERKPDVQLFNPRPHEPHRTS